MPLRAERYGPTHYLILSRSPKSHELPDYARPDPVQDLSLAERQARRDVLRGRDRRGWRAYSSFPGTFRLVDDERQFKKWQWIKVRVEKAKNDHRPESHKVFVDTIDCEGEPLSTKNEWQARRAVLAKLAPFTDFGAMEAARAANGRTLALLRPTRIVALDITPAKEADWTADEKEKLVQDLQQEGLFEDADAKKIKTLKKVPFDFHYRYECLVDGKTLTYRHKIADWEAGALYWTCRRNYGDKWEAPFRQKIERDLPSSDLMFLMGTIHRFPDQWLIVSLIYPPKLKIKPPHAMPRQGSLFGL
jgi:hypothetical protein